MSRKTTPYVHRTCARCGRLARRDELMVYSRFTRSRYCTDIAACDARVKRAMKAAVA